MLTAATLFSCDSSKDKDDDAPAVTTTELNGDLDGDGEVDFEEPITDYGDLNSLYDMGYDLMEISPTFPPSASHCGMTAQPNTFSTAMT